MEMLNARERINKALTPWKAKVTIGIVGSRRRNEESDKELLRDYLWERWGNFWEDVQFVSGGCPLGADRFADELAKEIGLTIVTHYPRRHTLSENPKRWDWARINYDRNDLIVRDCDVLLAVVAEDRKGGTEDSIKRAQKMKKEIVLLRD